MVLYEYGGVGIGGNGTYTRGEGGSNVAYIGGEGGKLHRKYENID